MASSARKPIVANPDKIVPPGLPTVPPPVPPTIRKPNRITSDGHGMREMAVSSTCLDSPLRFVTGPRLVVGKCLIEPLTSGAFTYVAFELGYGPHDSLGTVEINEEAVSGLDWVSSYEVHLGTTSQAASTLMQEYDGGWDKQYPGIAYVVFKITTASADHPGTWKVTAVPTGWKVTDFRDASTVIGNNPIVFAYQAYTHRRFKGLASAIIHDASWERVADMCDDVMGDSSKRYAFNAVVESGDSDVAIQEALDHCHAWLVEHGGELRMAAYMLPRPGDGTWAVTAGTTLAGTGGDATNDFAVGDRVLIKDSSNWYIRTITAIGGADSITVDGAAITVSAAKVMATSGVHIERDHWAQLPAMASTPPRSIPERMLVQFIQGTTGQPDLVYAGSQPTSDAFRQSPVMQRGCPSASQGTRWGETSIAWDALQRWSWQGIAGPMCPGAARLEPGDVYEFSDDDLTRQLAIVLSATHLADKHYLIACQKFDPDGPSSSTESDETPPTVGGGWDTSPPPNVTAVEYIASIYSDKPDNTTDLSNWSNAGVAVTDDNATDPNGGATADTAVPANLGAECDRNNPSYLDTATRSLGMVWARLPDGDGRLGLSGSGHDEGGSPYSYVWAYDMKDWWRLYPTPIMWGDRVVPHFRWYYGDGDLHDLEVWECYSFGEHDLATMWMEQMRWTAPASDADRAKISHVALQIFDPWDASWRTIYETPVEAEQISWGTAPIAQFGPLGWKDHPTLGWGEPTWLDWRLIVVGVNSAVTEFPDPAATKRNLFSLQTNVDDTADVDASGLADGASLTYKSGSGKKEYVQRARRASGHTTNNLAKLDANGDPVDSGVAVADEVRIPLREWWATGLTGTDDDGHLVIVCPDAATTAFTAQVRVPDQWAGNAIVFSFAFIAPTSPGSDEVVVWRFRYSARADAETFDVSGGYDTTLWNNADVLAAEPADTMYRDAITMTIAGVTAGDTLFVQFARAGAAGNDTHTASAHLCETTFIFS